MTRPLTILRTCPLSDKIGAAVLITLGIAVTQLPVIVGALS